MKVAPPVQRPRFVRYAWLLIPMGLVGAVTTVRSNGDVYGPTGIERIVVIDGALLLWLFGAAVASLVALCVAGWFRPARFPHPGVSALLGIATTCGGLALLGLLGLASLSSWNASSPVVGPDGHEYAALAMWESAAVGRVVGRSLARTEYDVLVCVGTDWPRRYAALVRPAQEANGALHFSPDGLVVLDHGGIAYAAARLDGSRKFDSQNIQSLSPFVLLDATTKGRDADVEGIAWDVRNTASDAARKDKAVLADPVTNAMWPEDRSGVPTEASLLDALDHANPWVRDAARRIVEAGGAEMYPKATKRLVERR
jgi:hypothetical protein